MGRALNVIGVPTGAATFTAALEGLTALDQQRLLANPGLPPIYESGVAYDAAATTKWRDVVDILEGNKGPKMKADCEALAPWRAAELRVTGEDPLAQVLVYPSGVSKFHAIVLRGNGTLEDPSVMLGMKAPAGLIDNYNWWNTQVAPRVSAEQPVPSEDAAVLGFDEDAACCGIDVDPTPGHDVVTFELCKTPDGCYRGQFRVPFIDGRALFGLSSTAQTPEEAEEKAARVLGFVGSVWDDLAALAPTPGAKAIVDLARNQHVQNLAKAAYGKTAQLFHRGGGGGGGNQGPSRQTTYRYDQGPPAPSDDQQQLSDTDAFFGTPPGGADDDDISGHDPHHHHGAHAEKRQHHEEAVIGWINAALVSGSRPATRGGGGGGRGGGSGTRPGFLGRGQAQQPQRQQGQQGQSSGPVIPGGFHMAPPPGAGPSMAPGYGQPYSAPTPYSTSTPYSPYAGSGFGTTAYGGGGFGGAGYSRGMFGQGAALWQQRQAQQQAQQQSGGGGGGDSGGGGGGSGGAGYDPMDYQAGAGWTDPDQFFSMPGYGTLTDQDFAQTAQLAQQIDQTESGYSSPDQFFGEQ